MKSVLIITTAFLSALAASNLSKYSPPHISKAIVCFQDTVPKNKQNMQQGQYRDIRTGQPLSLNYDRQRRTLTNSATGKPVDFYINGMGDTVSSYGYIVNNYLMMQPDSSYRLDMSRIRSANNRFYIIEGNKELTMDKNWPGSLNNRQQGNGQQRNRDQQSRRDSL